MEMSISNGVFLVAFLSLRHVDDVCFGLVLTELRVPEQTILNSNAVLQCRFDMNGTELYAIKWYKDGNEFYRYIPRNAPRAQVFLLPGLTIDLKNSTENQIVLNNVSLASAGRYTCEVSAEAPVFLTVCEARDMKVIALPDTGPTITGAKPWYHVGDMVRMNCSSGRSKPATTVTWFVNGEQATADMLRPYGTMIDKRQQLETTTLGLEFRVLPRHFKNGEIKLKSTFFGAVQCLASLRFMQKRTTDEDKLVGSKRPTSVSRRDRSMPDGASSPLDTSQVRNSSKHHSLPIVLFVVVIAALLYPKRDTNIEP